MRYWKLYKFGTVLDLSKFQQSFKVNINFMTTPIAFVASMLPYVWCTLYTQSNDDVGQNESLPLTIKATIKFIDYATSPDLTALHKSNAYFMKIFTFISSDVSTFFFFETIFSSLSSQRPNREISEFLLMLSSFLLLNSFACITNWWWRCRFKVGWNWSTKNERENETGIVVSSRIANNYLHLAWNSVWFV